MFTGASLSFHDEQLSLIFAWPGVSCLSGEYAPVQVGGIEVCMQHSKAWRCQHVFCGGRRGDEGRFGTVGELCDQRCGRFPETQYPKIGQCADLRGQVRLDAVPADIEQHVGQNTADPGVGAVLGIAGLAEGGPGDKALFL